MTAQDVIREIGEQLEKARNKHAPMHGSHEGYAVILEELDELWELVRAQKHEANEMKKEALHVAAMAARFVLDLCQDAPSASQRWRCTNCEMEVRDADVVTHANLLTTIGLWHKTTDGLWCGPVEPRKEGEG